MRVCLWLCVCLRRSALFYVTLETSVNEKTLLLQRMILFAG